MAARLGQACRDARLDAAVKAITVATTAGVSEATISKFERGLGGWRVRTDEIVQAYAVECGSSPQELWKRAISAGP